MEVRSGFLEVCRWPCARFAVRGRSFVEADSWFMNEGRSSCESSMALRSLVFFVCASRCSAFYGKSGAFSDHSPISHRRPHVIVTASASATQCSKPNGDRRRRPKQALRCCLCDRRAANVGVAVSRRRGVGAWVRGCVGWCADAPLQLATAQLASDATTGFCHKVESDYCTVHPGCLKSTICGQYQ